MGIMNRYRNALNQIPPPGSGCHVSLLSVANQGIIAGLEGGEIFSDIRQAIPPGTRPIPDKEITDAINKALSDHDGKTFTLRPRPEPIIKNGTAALQKIIEQGKIDNDDGLRESSPITLRDEPRGDAVLLIETLCKPDDLLWIGDRHKTGIVGDTIRPSQDWIIYFRNGGATAPHIIPNSLTGRPALKKSGEGETLRGDANVASYRYCVCEFDNISREDQIRFWSAAKLPIVCLIDSGGKSIHAWLDVQKLATVATSEQWDIEIKGRLYDRILKPLGVDSACSNAARLSRSPGHFRKEKNRYQRLLWLSPEGRQIL